MDHSATSENYLQKYYWQATYIDGKVVSQKDINFKDLDRAGLAQLAIVDPEADKYVITIAVHAGQKIAYRSRTIMQEDCNVVDRIHILSFANGHADFTEAFFIHEVLGHIEYGPFNNDTKANHTPVFNELDDQIIE